MSDLFGMLKSLSGQPAKLSNEAVLVTMVSKTGSSYRQLGAHLLVFPDGSWHGMLSGGCIEEEVARVALEVLSNGKPQSMVIDTDRWMGCRGTLKLQLHLAGGVLSEISEIASRRTFGRYLNTYEGQTVYSEDFDPSALLSQPIVPPVRLVMIGGGPDCQPLANLARSMDWQVEWICHPELRDSAGINFVEEKPRRLHPQSCPSDLKPDPRTAVVVMNHHFGRDAAYLEALWSSSIGYLGLLGSRDRANHILEQLVQRGLDPDRSLYSPAGLQLGGDGPQAVALSIVTQIQQILAA